MADELTMLIRRAKNGETEAFGEIYNLFFKRIYRYIYFLIGDLAMAQDLVQTTFLKAWKSLVTFSENKGTLQAFLFSIARNLVTDYRRKKKNLSLNLEYIQELSSTENIEEKFINKVEKERLYRALNHLNVIEKDIIVLHYFEDFPYAEIAKTVNMKEGAIRVRVSRALKKLKEILSDEK